MARMDAETSHAPGARTRIAAAAGAGWLSFAVAAVAFAPFARGLLLGRCLYFRDLAINFFPPRRFVVEGLLRGELWYWNPFLHEGVPVTLPPLAYPLGLLEALVPGEWGLSLLLALHVPLAALLFMRLAQGLGLRVGAASAGAIVYALGGFALSSVNLYVYVQALAWAPLVVLALLRAGAGGRRQVAIAALLAALVVSTTGVEVALQACLFGVALAVAARARVGLRLVSALALGAALSACVSVYLASIVEGTARGAGGFTTDVTLANSIHPLTLLQTVIGSFHGDLADPVARWWGQSFFPRGFPYVLSLYLGATALALAGVGLRHGRGPVWRIALLAAFALWIGLGQWGGLEGPVEAWPALRRLRYPVKAFFTVHFAVALLASFGCDALLRAERAAWRLLSGIGLALGGILVLLQSLPWAAPRFLRFFMTGFFPPDFEWPLRVERTRFVLLDAAIGGGLAAGAGLIALLVARGRLSPPRGVVAVAALLAADLLRTGAGLNPMVTRSFYGLSREMSAEAAALRAEGGRAFTCDVQQSPAYFRGRGLLGERHEAWSFTVFNETFTPDLNILAKVPSAYGVDLTMMVPLDRVLPLDDVACKDVSRIVERLRLAGVRRVLSLDARTGPDLVLRAIHRPGRAGPVSIRVYDLLRPLPMSLVVAAAGDAPASSHPVAGRIARALEEPGRLSYVVEANEAAALIVRHPGAPGWRAAVNGSPAPLLLADGKYLAARLPPGRSEVLFTYVPPGLRLGLGITAVAGLVTAALFAGGRRP
jgi:hypothetical protein